MLLCRSDFAGDGGDDGDGGGPEGDVLWEVQHGMVPVGREAVGEDEVAGRVDGVARGGRGKADPGKALFLLRPLYVLIADEGRETAAEYRQRDQSTLSKAEAQAARQEVPEYFLVERPRVDGRAPQKRLPAFGRRRRALREERRLQSHALPDALRRAFRGSLQHFTRRALSGSPGTLSRGSFSCSRCNPFSRSLDRSLRDLLGRAFCDSFSRSLCESFTRSLCESFTRSFSHSLRDSFSRCLRDSFSRSLRRSLRDFFGRSFENARHRGPFDKALDNCLSSFYASFLWYPMLQLMLHAVQGILILLVRCQASGHPPVRGWLDPGQTTTGEGHAPRRRRPPASFLFSERRREWGGGYSHWLLEPPTRRTDAWQLGLYRERIHDYNSGLNFS